MPTLEKGLARLGLSCGPPLLAAFHRYYEELAAWNRRVNLTRIVDYERVQTLHFLDSLTAAAALPEEAPNGGRLVDLGAGAGFPGLPLKMVFPRLRVDLVESVGKKAAFLRHVTETLALRGVDTYHVRAETLAHDPAHRGAYDAVVARGLAPLRVLVELALPFCRPGGVLIAHKKGDLAREVEEARAAMSVMGGELVARRCVDLDGLRDGRVLLVVKRVGAVPARYPRRPGIPKKRPL